ncbi:MAG: D-alanine--D-alanine ligase [Candidatus Marinimicrobia bacterium]|jgi:D-alanine-D-alanine ligase|nr:D-alanine--D-alanine ligase [Candidatus Neomarinimicrobiota bacterium]MBT3631478.1 D-alanine--D-alanine ligase [Candidatus Neomarinimicrobiota bacterium]MBT3825638.1 D-alanine--D-alanine ligase [Candidatus Neomarinimicrobiota bacterium]MBT4132476.1 D-alanine--D-alanine ligase [Candidatus Neomarinimicrobiota bacterium]MBT4294964.1 D-alanine--D-alanine ligase [Candidatus Neomarinimicrobiota bacterium]
MKVLLAGGGSSHEREVSLNSTAAMERALQELGYTYYSVDLSNELDVTQHWDDSYDIVLLGFHGRAGEDGLLQATLEANNIPFTGAGVADSLLAFSKDASKRQFKKYGIPTAEWELLLHERGGDLPETKLQLPYVIKPDNEGSTIGLSVCEKTEDLIEARRVSGAFSRLIFESFIPGRELTVGVLGNQVLPVVEIFPGHTLYDYESKYTKGMSNYKCPAELDDALTKSIQDLAVQAMHSAGVQVYGRVDFRLDPQNQPWCLEINTLPGMTETSLLPMGAAANGLSFPQLIDEILQLSLKKYS